MTNDPPSPPTVLVRPPGGSFARALSAQQPRPPLDAGLARRQHAEYCAALRAAGARVVELPPDERYPDACFVQDTAVVWGGAAVPARFGAPSREGEQAAVVDALRASRAVRLLPGIAAPGTLEGGDVLVLGSRLVVGLSERTNRAGLAQLRDRLEVEGASVEGLAVPEGLHLLSGCTSLGAGVLLAIGQYAGLPAFAGLEVIRVPEGEEYAANCLGLGGAVLVPAGYPRTAERIRAHGFRVLTVPLSEFAKADGGATCLALLI